MLASTLRRSRFYVGYNAISGRFVIPSASRKIADSILAATTLIESRDGHIDAVTSLSERALETSAAVRQPPAIDNHQSEPTPKITTVTFSDIAAASPHLLHVPKFFLCVAFNRIGVIMEDPYLVHAKELKGIGTWFTATFTDPMTKEEFSSGLAREVHAESQSSTALKPPLHLADTRIFEGRVYYRHLKLAEHAAAARAIDCYIYREKCPINIDHQLCWESPYIREEYGRSQTIDYDALMEKKCGISSRNPSSNHAKKNENEPNFSSLANSSPYLLHVPKMMLINAFQMCRIYCSNSFDVQSRTRDGKTWWTATFTDPITNETFSSGLTQAVQAKAKVGATLHPPLHLASAMIIDGKVYYDGSKFAEHAAAARAIDCYLFREGGAISSTKWRLCLENPYRTAEEGENQTIDYDTYLSQRNSVKYDNIIPGTEKNSCSLIQKMKHMLHMPKDLLDELFKVNYGVRKASYNVKEITHEKQTWYTATVTDPLTREQFPSGLGNLVRVEKKDDTSLRVPLYLAHVKILNGKVYYRKSLLAEHAAAARAIDCYLYRETHVIDDDIRLCLEDPYSTVKDGSSQRIDYDALLDERNAISVNDGSRRPIRPLSSCLFHVPTEFFNRAMINKYDDICVYNAKEITHENQIWYTATVTDPLTKEQFSSGIGNIVRVEKKDKTSLKVPLYLAHVKILNGKVYYRHKWLAKQAAAARAIDCYIYRAGYPDNNRMRLCLEDPYSKEDANQQIDYEDLLKKRNELTANADDEELEVDLTHLFRADEHPVNDGKVYEVDSGRDDFPAVTSSFVEETNNVTRVHNSLSTMGRILEIWTETPCFDPFSEQSYSNPTSLHEFASPKSRIKSILNWYERVNSEPINEGEALALVNLCNKILKSLGKANIDLRLEELEKGVSVQEDAKTILDRIISLSIAFDCRNPSFLCADTFTAYINCLNREKPANSAALAESLLKKMISNGNLNGINLPPPDVGTYNAVLGLWALVEGVEGQCSVNRVYSLLETDSSGSDNEKSLHPNKETFMTLLSVNSMNDGKFSFEQAKLWLHSLPALVADADFFSAALSSPSIKVSSNPANLRYANSWISSGDQFIGGFKSTSSAHSKDEADDMVKWLLYAEECGVVPNAEMYEAVIRAWIKTGTKDGLLLAEDWAKRAVSSNARIRDETFHPIIAAWAFCQAERAPARIKEWINQLTLLSTTKPHLKPSINTLSAQIISWRNVQAGIVDKAYKTQVDDTVTDSAVVGNKSKMLRDVEMTFAAAENCMHHLKDFFPLTKLHDVRDTKAIMSMLTHTIEAWGCASRFAQLNPTGSASLDSSHGIYEMMKVARLLDANIYGEITGEDEAHKILDLMGESYSEIISQLYQLDSASDSATPATSFFFREVADVEKMLYDFDFFARSRQGNFTPKSKTLRHKLYKEVLRGCAGVKSPADNGHVVRLCRLIMEQLSLLDEQCLDSGNGNVKEDITEIFVDIALLFGTAVKNPHERTYVLTVMWNNASHFFERRRKHESSSYATVDRARLIGAIRKAMKDSRLTEPFLYNFDSRPPKRRGKGNTWLAFVEELLGNRK
ncbi:hypothetical protein ACHAXA_006889 [Cyclostephanos tholiformis]|uniref:Uncharacterized protein n=1 Tax=Cyclostephanos tholiformis TaxID=382380 RepID=A0ABD3SDH4_9STRA